ncbi:hypothetical protein PG999_007822 [Apiospora kogelbergensis]|uniref:Uncharacterized protein n=1 Tax=Apiospora kogelbergensis TaxID=1337665 RepID=A0AAW0QS95_9PEZI
MPSLPRSLASSPLTSREDALSSTKRLVKQPPINMQNTGFLYTCGHRSGIYDEAAELYDMLSMSNLVRDWPNMERQVETGCAECWSLASTSYVLTGLCQQVLSNEHFDQEHMHSLFMMLYHLGNLLVADPSEQLLKLLQKWAECVASRHGYIDNKEYENRLYSAIYCSKVPRLVKKDAVYSIRAFRETADRPISDDADEKREAFATAMSRLEHRDRELIWSLSRPWPADLDDLLPVLAYSGIKYASLFKTKPLDLAEFGRAFESVAQRSHDYSIYVYHTKLVEAVQKLKLESYQLCRFAVDHSVVNSRDELKATMGIASNMKSSFENVVNLHAAFMGQLALWRAA